MATRKILDRDAWNRMLDKDKRLAELVSKMVFEIEWAKEVQRDLERLQDPYMVEVEDDEDEEAAA